MKRTISKMLGIAALAITAMASSLVISKPAQAATVITCAEEGLNSVTYPKDGNGVVGQTHAFVCKNTTTPAGGGTPVVTVPPTARVNTLFGAMTSGYGSYPFPAQVRTQLKNANVKYFFFNNRADADQYFAGLAPYNTFTTGPNSHSFRGANVSPATGGARCGNTGYGWSGGVRYIAVAIYNNCYYDNFLVPNKVVANPSLEKTILHETGHAFDFTFSTNANQSSFLSSRAGFTDLATKDKIALTPSAWSGWTNAEKDTYVCRLFRPNQRPSELERDLGATMDGGPNGEVCNSSSPSVRYAFFIGLTPVSIANGKLNYFVNNRQELFAETFVTVNFSTNGPAAFLQFTDNVLNNDLIINVPTGQPRAFNCVRNIVSTYSVSLLPPSANTPGCVTSGAL